MKIDKDKVVLLTYQLKSSTGELIDEATEQQPFAYIHDHEQALPAFEEKLQGLTTNDKFDFVLKSVDAYGEYDEDFIRAFDINMFQSQQLPEGFLSIGNVVPMQDQFGNHLEGAIIEITEKEVVIDFNHPLAGEDLHFSGKIIGVRNATNEELAHGHVHGLGGHHH